MVRALCRAADTGADVLYDVMLKVALMVDAAAHTYGMATFSQTTGERPGLKWVEGLDPEETADAEETVEAALTGAAEVKELKAGDRNICLVLSVATAHREGAAIYGRFVRPLTEQQASELRILSDVARLAHTHALLREELHRPLKTPKHAELAAASLPGMVFVSRAMTALANSVERIKDSDSTVLITGESGTGKELFARAVHRLSRRSQSPFIPFNCTAALISHFLSHYARRNDRAVAGITAEAIGLLQNYSWPGNVRELAAEIERLVLYTDEGSYIGSENLSERIQPADAQPQPAAVGHVPAHLENMLEDYERRVITETLRRNDYNVARAAVALGLGSRQTLYKKLKRLAINAGDFLQDDQQPGLQLRSDRA